jgi:hypothetical protein
MNNLEAMKRGFPFESLPAKFQEAARIANWLGYHFIWIDSVNQDSSWPIRKGIRELGLLR